MRRPILTALLGLSLLAASAVQAAPPKLTLAPRFGKALVPGYDQTVLVTLTNPKEAPAFRGKVSLRLGAQGWDAPVSLPAGASVATIAVPVHVPSSPHSLWVTLRSARGEILVSTAGSLPEVPPGVLSVLVVRQDGSAGDWEPLHNQISGVRRVAGRLKPATLRRGPMQMGPPLGMGKPGAPPRGDFADYFSVVTAVPSQLSERAGELEPFGIVVLGDVDPQALSKGQLDALLRWVNAGGVLVRSGEAKERVENWGAGRIVHTKDRPSVKALVGAPNYVGMLRETALAATEAQEEGYAGQELETNGYYVGLFSEVLQSNAVQAPPFSTIVLFLGAYLIVVVPIQYILLRRLDKREWAWGTTPILAGVFALGAYGVGSQGRSHEVFYNTASVIETQAGQTTGAAIARFGLYSPIRMTYTLTAPTIDTMFFSTVGDIPHLTTLQTPELPGQLDGVSVPQWAIRSVSFHTNDLPLGGGVAVDLKRDGEFLVGRITNNTPVTLEGISLFATEFLHLAALTPGESLPIRLRYNDAIGSVWFAGGAGRQVMDEKHYFGALEGAIANYDTQTRSGEILILARVAQELVPVKVEGAAATPKITDSLLIVHAPVPPRQ